MSGDQTRYPSEELLVISGADLPPVWNGLDEHRPLWGQTLSAHEQRLPPAEAVGLPTLSSSARLEQIPQSRKAPYDQHYDIQVFGQSFHLTSEKSEAHVRTVAAYVDEKMRERARVSRTLVPLRVAIMTALGIADELFDIRAQSDDR